MSYEDKFEVSVDETANVLEVQVEVVCRPPWVGVSFYDLSIIIAKLKKLGYDVSEKDCLENLGTVRSDDGRLGNKKTYKFKLKGKTKKATIKKTPPPAATKPVKGIKKEVKLPIKEAEPLTKEVSTKTTSDVLKEYAKKKNN